MAVKETFEFEDTPEPENEKSIVAQREAQNKKEISKGEGEGKEEERKEEKREGRVVSFIGTLTKVFYDTLFAKVKAEPLDDEEREKLDKVGRQLDEKYHIDVFYAEEIEAVGVHYEILSAKGRWTRIKEARAERVKRDKEEKRKRDKEEERDDEA